MRIITMRYEPLIARKLFGNLVIIGMAIFFTVAPLAALI